MNEYCIICGRPAKMHHLIFGEGRRPISDTDKLVIPLCSYHHTVGDIPDRIHDNRMAEYLSKALGQALWERDWILYYYDERDTQEELKDEAREAFIKRYGRSWL